VKRFKPDVVVGVGGYASGPVGRVASRRGIPLVLQEQNSYAGVTNRLLAKRATKICVAYEGMERFFEAGKVIFTGNPVRAELLQSLHAREEGIAFHGLDPGKKTVLVTGGSLGAGSINRAMMNALEQFAAWEGVQLLWQCGSFYHAGLERQLAGRLPANVVLLPFLKRMDLAYACADLVVARAGAGTISELCLLGKAAVLVPSPNVAEDHQTKNALALVNKGAAVMIKDHEIQARLGETLRALLDDDERRLVLSRQVKTLGIADADERIARIILEIETVK
jgi:UDP-N-acetylglucosamine--N-acetylmuramyl-(pentapeptide) pyrophosphoryl-undecaprenol N-acetylglucosamine transferase